MVIAEQKGLAEGHANDFRISRPLQFQGQRLLSENIWQTSCPQRHLCNRLFAGRFFYSDVAMTHACLTRSIKVVVPLAAGIVQKRVAALALP